MFKSSKVGEARQDGPRSARHGWTIADEIYEILRKRILTGTYLPGDRLRPGHLAAEAGVSSTVLREALMRLVAEGLVQSQSQQGFAVVSMAEDELRDLMSMRILVDSEGLRRSIRDGGILWQSRVVAAHHLLANTDVRDGDELAGAAVPHQEAHTDFHHALISGCGSPRIISVSKNLYMASELYRRLSRPLSRGKRQNGAEHKAIMDAALAGDEQTAVTRLEEHYLKTVEILVGSHMLRAKPDEASPHDLWRPEVNS